MTPSASADPDLAQAMAKAIAESDCDRIRFLHDAGADVNARDGVNLTHLQNAANEYRADAVATLLDLGADPDLPGGGSGFTAMHYAAYRCNHYIMGILLAKGATPDVPNNWQKTALHESAFSGSLECVKLLVEAGADITLKDDHGHTPKEIAELRAAEKFQFAQGGFREISEYLQRAQIALEAQNTVLDHDITVRQSLRPRKWRP